MARPLNRNGGRRKGSKNKSTLEREELAARELAAREAALVDAESRVLTARRAGQKLGREVIEDLMNLGAGLSAHFQMNPPGQPVNPNEDPDKFWKAAIFTLDCAKALADYQSPKLKAIMVSAPPPDVQDQRKRFTLTIFEGGPGMGAQAALPMPTSARRMN